MKLNGKPQGLAGLAAHLFYHEPFNYAFIACIQNETFHKFCKRGTRDAKGVFDEDFLRDLVLVLSHFFARKKLHESHLKNRNKSMIQLQELPSMFLKVCHKIFQFKFFLNLCMMIVKNSIERLYLMYLVIKLRPRKDSWSQFWC